MSSFAYFFSLALLQVGASGNTSMYVSITAFPLLFAHRNSLPYADAAISVNTVVPSTSAMSDLKMQHTDSLQTESVY